MEDRLYYMPVLMRILLNSKNGMLKWNNDAY